LALGEALGRACQAYAQPEVWKKIVAAGMKQDWSWSKSARQYVELYRATIKQVRGQAVTGNA
jgi:starch synthase